MRVVKEAEERRNEILDVAERLFVLKGYDNTSTNDILNEIGIARGTLYYHFKSKEDILDAMIDRINRQLTDKAMKIVSQKEIPVLQCITMTIMALNVDNSIGDEIIELVHRPQNALLHQRMQEKVLAGVNPLITKLIREGMEQGIFQTNYPEEAVEMIMLHSTTVFDSQKEYTQEEKNRKMMAFLYHLERIFGMEEGSVQAVILPIFQEDAGK